VYAALNSLIGLVVWVSGGRIEPREYDLKEYWTWRGPGKQPWFVRAMQKKGWLGSADADSQSKQGFNLPDGGSSLEHSRHNSSRDKFNVPLTIPVAIPEPAVTPAVTRH
jgi:adenine/guanine/hypoxanthine permease